MKKKEVNIIIVGQTSTGKSSLMFLFKEFLKEKGIEYNVKDGDYDLPTEELVDEKFSNKKELITKVLQDKVKVNLKIVQTNKELANING